MTTTVCLCCSWQAAKPGLLGLLSTRPCLWHTSPVCRLYLSWQCSNLWSQQQQQQQHLHSLLRLWLLDSSLLWTPAAGRSR